MIKSIATRFEITPGANLNSADFGQWLTDFAYSALALKGFFSSEIIAPEIAEDKNTYPVWTVIHRFDSDETCSTWLDSQGRKAQLEALEAKFDKQVRELTASASLFERGSSIVAIETYVAPGKEESYCQWKRKLEAAQSVFPGYRGSYLQAPVPGRANYWSSIVRFAGAEDLEYWLQSPQRLALVEENKVFGAATRIQVIGSTFPGWEPTISGKPATPAWKTAGLVILGLYPLLVIQRHYLLPLLSGFNPALTVAITTLCSVGLVSFVCMPYLVKQFTWWLMPAAAEEAKLALLERKGTMILVGLFLLEVAVLSYAMAALR
jgi:antibiotic biosynthesis monooxygenase (ABM) superfamily enzyme